MTSEQRSASTPRARAALVLGGVTVVGLVLWGVLSASGAGDAEQPGTASGSPSSTPGTSTSLPSTAPTSTPTPSGSAAPSALPSAPATSAGATAPPGSPPGSLPTETLAPVPLDAVVEPTADVELELASLESVDGAANIAGEIAGPAIRVTVEATNTGDDPFPTPVVVVNLYIGEDRLPANEIREPGGRAFPASIPAGGSSSGVYLFTVPHDQRGLIGIEVVLQAGEPVVLFEGAAR
ncbi:hypothetical protein [Agrococcus sp. SCSIO52902]|uniref:hypothetical protein n=1 Tax=Agrococcus sp. SCSIO52902 TaxID=2933290 RepID=UPI001FF4BE0D|nr:hypothetical protein [Agrococcus sp. SCSIO52902]UOW00793.1 hypothetical protein MU522_12940 [Agrococcus sp. SCSIO52902]UOW00855.1 hypothetical protein MU522_00020 [Agrococcus sp. SCSIO52902]